jgi:hypothetical protein
MCFAGAIACVAAIVHLVVPRPERVDVCFDQSDRDYNTRSLYELIHHADPTASAVLGKSISFGDHRNLIGLQVADLLAYESMKDLDNQLAARPRRTRQSLVELRRSRRFEYVGYDGPRLERHRRIGDALHGDPARGRRYNAWLAASRLKDSLQNRLLFTALAGIQ